MNRYLLTTGIGLLLVTATRSQQQSDQDFASSAASHTEYKAPLLYRDLGFYSGKNAPFSLLKSYSAERTLDKNKGSIIGYTSSGEVQFVGHYKGAKLKGEWKSYYNSNQLCDSGTILNDVPDGVWKSWYENGQLRFIRTFNAFKLQKAKQDISRRSSRIINSPIVTIAREDLSTAYSYLNAAYSFHTIAKKNNAGRLSRNGWNSLRDRVDHNTSTAHHDYLPPFLESLHHGLYMNFYPNGSVKDSGYYQNGLREGVWEEWINNGEIRSTGFYYRGHKKDTWKYFDRDGQLRYLETYNRNGKLVFRKQYR